MIAGQRYFGSNVDVWSCGVIMFALICGYLPFEDPNTTNLYQKILKGNFQIPKFVSKDAADLLKHVLCTDPEKRYKIDDIRKHRWFNQVPLKDETDRLSRQGLIIGVNIIPVNRKILSLLEEKYGFKREYAKKCLLNNKHNHVTTTYYLLYQKYERLGMLSKEDELDLLSEEEDTGGDMKNFHSL
jgi:5'-AMP-activated protein kinase catalytic alpha subunit